jgi:hypothetical protein
MVGGEIKNPNKEYHISPSLIQNNFLFHKESQLFNEN